jgi:hypothetical protein
VTTAIGIPGILSQSTRKIGGVTPRAAFLNMASLFTVNTGGHPTADVRLYLCLT